MNITKDNYKLLAVKHYRNPILVDAEFSQDLILITRVINRLKKFLATGELKTKMVYNNYIIACNCFGKEYVIKTLFLLSEGTIHQLLKSWLSHFEGLSGEVIVNDKLTIDITANDSIHPFVERLRKDIGE